MQSLGIIPGYSRTLWRTGSLAGQTVRLLLFVGGVVLAVDQLWLIQPRLYLAPQGGVHASVFRVLGLAVVALGWRGASSKRPTPERASLYLRVGAVLMALTGIGRFFAYDFPQWAAWLGDLAPLGSLGLLGVALPHCLPVLGRWLRLKDGTRVWFHPIALGAFATALAVEVIIAGNIGPLRASLAIGGHLVASAWLMHGDFAEPAPSHRRIQGQVVGTFLLLGALSLWVEHICPLSRVLTSSHPLVYTTRTSRLTLDVTTGQGSTHYFVNSELRFSTVDEKRYATSMTLPAAVRVKDPRAALVMSWGEGLLERELLAYSQKLRITSVVRDAQLARASRRQATLHAITEGSLSNPRVSLVERDPAAYALLLRDERFDLIVVDLPDPSGPLESKYYIRLFYRKLAEHLAPGGLLTVQATSARRSPRSFAIIGETLRAAGLSTTPLMIPLITRGEWSAYVCALGVLPPVVEPGFYRNTFPGSIEPQMMHPWPDTLPPRDFHATPSTLHDAVIVDWFERESGELAHERTTTAH